ncbi:hypothetical protein SAMN05216337_102064 [Bradyrhizobium brasilense]|uniref:Bacteriophage tail tape measure N-terminal domain-containing protein n=1 Tax=Bradyrhizobium brasilense TaxID=1419277 RepID=A0A1G7ABK5_9BRAD|nr:hypothetical protein [Bradyrhizobium brasilense]SDE12338.1 hypothetical protein SAMN05216337_102064 [Bradyrhizobium brasilense]
MADGDIVRSIKISATGENIESTTNATLALGEATAALTAATIAQTKVEKDSSEAYRRQIDAVDHTRDSHESLYSTLVKVAATVAGVILGYEALVATLKAVWTVATLAPRLLAEAWRLGGEELQRYRDIAKNAGDLSTDFFQRISKAASDAKIPLDALTTAFKNLNDATADKLGGSEAQKKLDELTKAGNFKGNTGVAAFTSADGAEAKNRAAVNLFEQAVQAGQRRAALDFAKTIWGDDAAKNLAKNQDYMRNILQAADAIDSKTLVSQQSIDNAIALQNRYDAAVAILEQRWHPVQDVLTTLGVKMRGIWVDIVSSIADAVDRVAKLVEKIGEIPQRFWDYIKNGANAAGNVAASVGPAFGPLGAVLGTGGRLLAGATNSETASTDPMDVARALLASRLGNPTNIANAQRDAVSTAYRVRKDTSKVPGDEDGPDASAYDRATESLLKYIEVTKAASLSVDAGAAEQEKLKAIATLTAAGIKDGLTLAAAAAKAEMSGLGTAAGAAAEQLAKAKVASQINFARNTALLSPEDVQIASQLKSIYPDVATALNSVEAQAIRTNNVLADMNNTGRSLAQGIGGDLLQQVRSGASAWDAFKTAGVNALGKISDKLMQMAIDNLWSKALGGSTGSGLLSFFGFGGSKGSNATDGIGGFGPTVPAYANGTDSAPGGWSIVGEKGPELMNVPKGAQILPNGVSPGGGDIHVSFAPSYNVQGSGPEIAALKAQMAQDRAEFEDRTIAAVRKAKAGRNL